MTHGTQTATPVLPARPSFIREVERDYLASYRKARRRLDAIVGRYDFAGKRVLDLGCSRGYFSFRLAAAGADVTGIDGDRELVARNQSVAERYGVHNLKFEHAFITSDLLRSLERYDAVLFLSVLHHIMTDSRVYSWYQGKTGLECGTELLSELARKTDVLFFEIGVSSEAHDWAKKMPDMGADPAAWVVHDLLAPAGFGNVEIIPPPEFQGLRGAGQRWLHQHCHEVLSTSVAVPARVLRRLTGFDTRDRRPLFFARSRAGKENSTT